MEIPKPSDDLKALFRSLVPDAPGVEVKPMFGNVGAFVNGNMFAGLFGPDVGVRILDHDSLAELEAIEGVGPFGPAGRPMGGYVSLPRAWQEHDHERAAEWIGAALEQTSRLPAKQPRSRKKKG